MEKNEIKQLYHRYINGAVTEDEKVSLFLHMDQLSDIDLDELIESEWNLYELPDDKAHPDGKALLFQLLQERQQQQMTPVRKISAGKKWIWAAASVLLISGGLYLGNKLTDKETPATTAMAQQSVDVDPGETGALLKLDDGTQILLDSANNGVIARAHGTEAVLNGGALSYQASDKKGQAAEQSIAYHTVVTPNGRQFKLTLPDGSLIWLNAASSVKYPVRFPANEREIEITGEVFVEVKKNSNAPFRVKTPAQKIEVLGTGFNVSAYRDDATEKTTLIDGAVKVTGAEPELIINENNAVLLKPGQQAEIEHGRSIKLNRAVDIEQVTAWKNGAFNFNDKKLDDIMRQIARWYNVEISYEVKIPDRTFWGGMSRNLTLTKCLSILEKAKLQVKFRLEEGRRLVVVPAKNQL